MRSVAWPWQPKRRPRVRHYKSWLSPGGPALQAAVSFCTWERRRNAGLKLRRPGAAACHRRLNLTPRARAAANYLPRSDPAAADSSSLLVALSVELYRVLQGV